MWACAEDTLLDIATTSMSNSVVSAAVNTYFVLPGRVLTSNGIMISPLSETIS